MSSTPSVTPRWLTAGLTRVFAAAGLSDRAAATVAEALVDADLRGIPSHGAMLTPMYVDRLRRGSVTTAERAEVVPEPARLLGWL